jgi:DNA-binding cell septation regulator SpoVG
MATLELTGFHKTKIISMGKLRAFIDVVFNDALVVKGYKVIEGSKGLFVAPPARKVENNDTDTKSPTGNKLDWADVVFITKESNLRDAIHGKILKHYRDQVGSATQGNTQADPTAGI